MKNILRLKTCLLLLALTSIAISAHSQSIRGIIKNPATNEPVPFASVVIYNAKGKVIAGGSSENDGAFTINYGNEVGTAKLEVSFIGYKNLEKSITLSGKSINIGNLLLEQDAVRLAEAKVSGITQRATLKGDTTELNAEAFKVNPDATAQDLLIKMPGISSQNGRIQAQGEEVKRVLVDGKEYFSDDVSAALGNLPAELIDKVQIFDEQSEMSRFTGFNDGNTNKALNILTKRGMSKSVVGRGVLGYGTDDRYRSNVTLNALNNDRRISVMAQSNNVNEQNFSVSDIVGATGSSGRGGRGANSEFMVNNNRGITQTNAVGLNYSDKWGKKIKFTGSYFLNRGENENIENIHQEFVNVQNLGQVNNESSVSNNTNINHRVNVRFEYQIDSSNSLLLIPRLTLQENNSISASSTIMNNATNGFINSSKNDFISNLSGLNFSNSLLYRHRFNNKRTVTLGFDNSYTKNDGDNHQENFIKTLTTPDSTLIQQMYLDQNGWAIAPSISYTEAISKRSMLMADYKITYQSNESDKRFYELDTITNIYNQNNLLSNVFGSHTTTQLTGLSYMYNSGKAQLNLKTSYQNLRLDNTQVFPVENVINQSFSSILPSARLMYKFARNKNLMLNYRTSAAPPSISQLQDVLDNSNPVQLRTGNPKLKQNYNHSLFSNYNSTNINGNSFFVMFGGLLSNDYIGNNMFIAEADTVRTIAGTDIFLRQGTQLTSPENMSGFFNISSSMTYGFPIRFLQSNLNITARASYSRTPGIINDVKNYAYQPNLGGGFTLGSNISPNVDFTLGSNGAYNIVRNSTQTRSDNNYYTMSSFFRINLIFWKSLVLQSDINHTLYLGAVTENNQNYYLWNTAIAYKFLKKKGAELKLSAFDLLGQNISFSRTTNALYAQDVTNNTLTRYFMLTFTYNLRKYNGGNEVREDQKFERPPMRVPGGRPMGPPMGGGGGGPF